MAKGQVQQALENIHQARVALGLPAEPPEGTSFRDVPANLDQTFSSVRQALSELLQSAAKLGIDAIVLRSHAEAGDGGILQARSGRRYR